MLTENVSACAYCKRQCMYWLKTSVGILGAKTFRSILKIYLYICLTLMN